MNRTKLHKELFGRTSEGSEVYLFRLTNANGLSVSILTLGGIIQSLKVPDKNGKFEDITPGFDTLEEYESNPPYFGAIIGRVANRISEGKYKINGKQYQAPLNRDHICLHGGIKGFDKKCWTPVELKDGLRLQYTSPAGEESFPGNLKVTVTYGLSDDNVLSINMGAETDEETIINLTNHAYFNLASHKAENVYDHTLQVDSQSYLPKNEHAAPTGEIATVEGTPFDFRKERNLGEALRRVVEDSVVGIDHCLCLKPLDEMEMKKKKEAVILKHPQSGRVLTISTDQPGVQVYTGNYLDGLKGKDGAKYKQHSSVALEAQFLPDAPNQSGFPSINLKPGVGWSHCTEIKFSVEH